jgi:hypothetical protein
MRHGFLSKLHCHPEQVGLFLLFKNIRCSVFVINNCFYLFLYQVISLTSTFIKLSVSGNADVEYAACRELTAIAPKECLWHKADPEILPIAIGTGDVLR